MTFSPDRVTIFVQVELVYLPSLYYSNIYKLTGLNAHGSPRQPLIASLLQASWRPFGHAPSPFHQVRRPQYHPTWPMTRQPQLLLHLSQYHSFPRPSASIRPPCATSSASPAPPQTIPSPCTSMLYFNPPAAPSPQPQINIRTARASRSPARSAGSSKTRHCSRAGGTGRRC